MLAWNFRKYILIAIYGVLASSGLGLIFCHSQSLNIWGHCCIEEHEYMFIFPKYYLWITVLSFAHIVQFVFCFNSLPRSTETPAKIHLL